MCGFKVSKVKDQQLQGLAKIDLIKIIYKCLVFKILYSS